MIRHYVAFTLLIALPTQARGQGVFAPGDPIWGGQIVGESFEVGVVGTNADTNNWPENESPEQVIDGVGQKYLNFGKEHTGFLVTPSLGSSVAVGMNLWTANDFGPRDPASYELYGTNSVIGVDGPFSLAEFTLISSSDLALPDTRNGGGNTPLPVENVTTVPFENTLDFTSYLISFPTLKSSAAAAAMQIAEVQLLTSLNGGGFPPVGKQTVYGFDDGTLQGWVSVDPFGDPLEDDSFNHWVVTDEVIDNGDGFDLLQSTTGQHKVIPDPDVWDDSTFRDCLAGEACLTQILRSPIFEVNQPGPITIDMIGGGAHGDQPADDSLNYPESPEDLPEFKTSSKSEGALQGLGLLDVEANSYVAFAFSSRANDGKMRETDPPERGTWETAMIPASELADLVDNGRQYRIDVFDSYAGGWGWIGFDSVTVPYALAGSCDVNGDGSCDAADIDAMTQMVVDGQETQEQRTALIESPSPEGFNTWIGDSDLNGQFDDQDFVKVFIEGKYLTGEKAGWDQGDWDGNFLADDQDVVAAFIAGGYLKGQRPAVAAVPEPSSLTLLTLGLLAFARSRPRIRRK